MFKTISKIITWAQSNFDIDLPSKDRQFKYLDFKFLLNYDS